MTAPIPHQRGPRADTVAVATMMRRSPSYIRRLVHAGVLHPVGTEQPKRGRPRMLFDLLEVTRVIDDTPTLLGPVLDKQATRSA